MPCSDGPPHRGLPFAIEEELLTLKDKLDTTARYLCGVLGWLESQHMVVGSGNYDAMQKGPGESLGRVLREIEVATPGVNPGDIQDWWEAHQEQDEARQDDQRSAFVAGGE